MFKKMCKQLNPKLILTSAALFIVIFYIIDISDRIAIFHTNSLKFEFLLTIVFFVICLLLFIVTKAEHNKQMYIKFTQICDLLEEEISISNPKTLKFTYVNKGLLNNTQHESNELLGQHIAKTNPDCEQSNMQEFIKPLIIGEVDKLTYTTIRLRKDGSKYPIKTTLKYFKETNSLVAFSIDITNEKKIENIRYQFISSINHELRTPLTAISGALSIISNDLVGEVPAPMKEMVNVATNNTIRLLELVGDLVNAEKLQAKYDFDFTTKPLKE